MNEVNLRDFRDQLRMYFDNEFRMRQKESQIKVIEEELREMCDKAETLKVAIRDMVFSKPEDTAHFVMDGYRIIKLQKSGDRLYISETKGERI